MVLSNHTTDVVYVLPSCGRTAPRGSQVQFCFSLEEINIVAAAKNYHSYFKYVFLFYVNINLCLVMLTITMTSAPAKAVGGISFLATVLQ